MRRSLLATFVAVVAAYAVWAALTLGLRSSCGNEVLQEIDSQDHRYTASLFERNCGATAPFVRIISLRATGTQLDTEAKETWVLVLSGQHALQVRWVNERHLVIKGAAQDPKALIRSPWLDVRTSLE